MNAPPFTLTNESITIIWEGKSYTVRKGSPQFVALRKAVFEGDWDIIPDHLSVSNALKNWVKGKFTIDGETLKYEGEVLPVDLHNRILEMATNGEDPSSLLKFWERLQKNPSHRSVSQLWPFLSHQGIPFTKDGCFLAYKGVKEDFKDVHTGTFDNRPGVVHEMPRNKVSDDPNEACHYGFHVGALTYASGFGPRVVVCKVAPEDVVCVPYDSNNEKMRVCKYEVLGHHNGSHLPSTSFEEEQYDEDDADEDDTDSDDEICDECEAPIPGGVELVNVYHQDSCSLYEESTFVDESSLDKQQTPVSKPQFKKKFAVVAVPVDEEDQPVEPKTYFLNEQHTTRLTKTQADKERAAKVLALDTAKRKSKKGFAKLDKLDMEGLLKQPTDVLRKYAIKGLQIVGASRIPGGKVALVTKILEVRA